METYIKAIHLINFRKFTDATITVNSGMNIFVGDNGAGKSSILQAIDLALSGSATRVLSYGFDNLMNVETIEKWKKAPQLDTLPKTIIELILEMTDSPKNQYFHGEQHYGAAPTAAYGIKMVCEPNPDQMEELSEAIRSEQCNTFPFSFYFVSFSTFSNAAYTGFKKPVKSKFIDNACTNTTKALRNIVTDTYQNVFGERERAQNEHNFARHLNQFSLPQMAKERGLVVSAELEDLLDIRESGISLSNRGEGAINIAKTESTLVRDSGTSSVVIIEEPENHLSPVGLRKLVNHINRETAGRQLFIATHSSYITTRLGLKHAFFVGDTVKSFNDLNEDTANFFMRAPNDNLLQFILAKKVVLVEGAAEYILMDEFILQITGRKSDELGIWILSLNNLSFQRYFELANKLGIKVAAIRDNDKKTSDWYRDCVDEAKKVFVDSDLKRYTFEVCLYSDNKNTLSKIFASKQDPLAYMLANKAEAALLILKSNEKLVVPSYIQEAIRWIVG
ncbi:MAG: AAA family ATPase [Victivallales bacterium]|nr:AAA family ATPase [Victivallales bacterium]